MGDGGDKQKHKNKKQKRSKASEGDAPAGGAAGPAPGHDADGEGAGPSGRKWTLSIAVPGTLLDSPPSLEVAVCIAAQIARAAAAFQVDEVVVYDDSPAATAAPADQSLTAAATISPGTALLASVLQFLDTPPHLRPNIYGDLSSSGGVAGVAGGSEDDEARRALALAAALPPLTPPHHARPSGSGAWMPYREGVVLKSGCEAGAGSYVDVGLDRMVWLEHELPQSTRVTVHMGDTEPVTRFMAAYSETMIVGTVVPPSLPRERLGLYWGYTVRLALGLQRVFKGAVVSKSGGYDLTIGCSPAGAPTDPGALVLPAFRHALLVFGGGSGGAGGAPAAGGPAAKASGGKKAKEAGKGAAAAAAAGHQDLEQMVPRVPDWEHKMPQDVFNLYLNTTPHLGTLRLRPEDAAPVALAYLITPLLKYGKA